jgi:hypothetical protein
MVELQLAAPAAVWILHLLPQFLALNLVLRLLQLLLTLSAPVLLQKLSDALLCLSS